MNGAEEILVSASKNLMTILQILSVARITFESDVIKISRKMAQRGEL